MFQAKETIPNWERALSALEELQEGWYGYSMKTITGILGLSLVFSFPDLRLAMILKMTI